MHQALSAVMFFPRGGSAHTARALATELARHGWRMRLVAGSLPEAGEHADARAFYRGVDVRPVRFASDPAPGAASADGEPVAPMHPSFEDRPGAPDPVFASLDDDAFERQVAAWAGALEGAGLAAAELAHLHHLTPLNEAVARLAPSKPVVGQLHGTELLMLERIAAGDPPAGWAHATEWERRIRGWAARCRRLLVAPGGLERAAGLLELEPARFHPLPNGFDPAAFKPRALDRTAHWRRHLVESPQGWLPGREAGSAAYGERDLAPFADGVVCVYVGRYTEVKRLGLLIRAHARARGRFRRPAPLVLVGGHPGEWEGEHPAEVIARTGARDVFLAGWHDHDELPAFFAASDVLVFPSIREQFGQVLVEGMACEVPPVAAASFGARGIVEDGRTGWLVAPDDEEALARALVEAVNDGAERRLRGELARREALARYSWPEIAAEVAVVFAEAAGE